MADDQDSILKVIVELVDKVSEPLRKVNESFEEFSESVHGILTSGAEVFAGYEAIKGLVEPAMAMAEAQTHLALASNMSAEELAKMKEQAASLSEAFPASMEAITAAQEEMYKTLGAGGDVEAATTLATKLATVLGVDATSGANALAGAYEQLGDKSKPVIEQMGIIGDKLAILKNLYMKPGEASSLERDIQRIGKSAQAAGISQNQMFAIWAEGNKLHAGGPRGFGMVEASLFDTLAKSSKELEKAGLQVVHFSNGGVNMIATLERINALTDHGKMKLFAELPGQAKVLVEMAAHLNDVKAAMDSFRNSGGALDKSSNILANTPEAKMERLKDTVQVLADTVGTQLLPQLIPLITRLNEWTKSIDDFLNRHPAVAKALGDFALGVAALLTAGGAYGFVKIIGNVIKLGGELLGLPAVMGLVQSAWFVLQTAMIEGSAEIGTAMLLAFESNPIGWILTGIAAVALASYEIYKHWADIKALWDQMGDFFKLANAAGSGETFKALGQAAWHNLLHPIATESASSILRSDMGMTYSPTVNVNVPPGADAHSIGTSVVDALSGHATTLDQFLRDRQHETSRRSFGDPTMSMFGR